MECAFGWPIFQSLAKMLSKFKFIALSFRTCTTKIIYYYSHPIYIWFHWIMLTILYYNLNFIRLIKQIHKKSFEFNLRGTRTGTRKSCLEIVEKKHLQKKLNHHIDLKPHWYNYVWFFCSTFFVSTITNLTRNTSAFGFFFLHEMIWIHILFMCVRCKQNILSIPQWLHINWMKEFIRSWLGLFVH